jgi:hypothetical protein
MKVTIRCGGDEIQATLAPGATVDEALSAVGYENGKAVLTLVNGGAATGGSKLKSGDTVSATPKSQKNG